MPASTAPAASSASRRAPRTRSTRPASVRHRKEAISLRCSDTLARRGDNQAGGGEWPEKSGSMRDRAYATFRRNFAADFLLMEQTANGRNQCAVDLIEPERGVSGRGSRGDSGIVQAADFGARQSDQPGQDFVGVFAEAGRRQR